ncbi:DUF402 domain-containing protein [Phytoactinopolyspora halotolerans]|uniref:DUF402 domain-containing protein n=1 Tax=Phytoactinopolyspora halotolerans TaxID=1981512 RepID=UPI001C20B31E|nr:DUF402 domain-containing protein [Phytoactinopolyspora halotolerans]
MEDGADLIALALWPGIELLAATTWTESQRTGSEAVRNRGVGHLASGEWELGPWAWRDTTRLMLSSPDSYFTVSLFFDDNGSQWIWYVDFERPYRRTLIGYDTFDLMLDLVIELDGTYRWKDKDEYDQGRRLGIITDDDHKRVSDAQEQVISLLSGREGAFHEHWTTWRRDPHWPRPVLPSDALTIPTHDV